MKINKQITNQIVFLGAIGVSIFLLFFIIACTWIGFDVKTQCHNAKSQYRGDCVNALILLLKDDKNSFRSRNSAIWALGQMGDKRALPVLKRFYTGIIPEREPLNKSISQYELKKAINLANGGVNITAIFWRYGIE